MDIISRQESLLTGLPLREGAGIILDLRGPGNHLPRKTPRIFCHHVTLKWKHTCIFFLPFLELLQYKIIGNNNKVCYFVVSPLVCWTLTKTNNSKNKGMDVASTIGAMVWGRGGVKLEIRAFLVAENALVLRRFLRNPFSKPPIPALENRRPALVNTHSQKNWDC